MTQHRNLPASRYSKMFWLDSLRLPPDEQSTYHVYGVFHYAGKLDGARLESALRQLVSHNYNLRTTFVLQGESLRQIIVEDPIVELSHRCVRDDGEHDRLVDEAIREPFDLARGPLFRFLTIFHEGRGRTTFLPIFHHIILDGTQFDALMDQIGRYYHQPSSVPGTDEADLEALQNYLDGEEKLIEPININYWLDKLEGYPLRINFPKRVAPPAASPRDVRCLKALDGYLYTRVRELGEKTGCSVFQILKTAWASLVSQYADQDRLVLSFPVNRRGKAHTALKGAFVNTPFSCFDRQGTFLEALFKAKHEADEKSHWSASRVEILSALKDTEHDFSVSFSQSDLFIRGPLLDAPAEAAPDRFVGGTGGAKLCFFFQETETGLKYGIVGATEWVDAFQLRRMQGHFEVLLGQVLADPEISLRTLSCLSAEEHDEIVYTWNSVGPASSVDRTIQGLFEARVDESPDGPALRFGERGLSYDELDRKANQLAHHLRESHGIRANDLIALCLDRSEEMLIAILGVLKAGGAYVPLDPSFPSARIKCLLDDTKPKTVIANHRYEEKLAQVTGKLVLPIDSPDVRRALTSLPIVRPENRSVGKDLAYVIYTSGTTGQPKGVMVEHAAVVSFAVDSDYVSLRPGDQVLGLSDYAFDGSIFDFFSTLLNGACLHLTDRPLVTEAWALGEIVRRRRISHVFATTSLFHQYVAEPESPFAAVPHILIGGEPADGNLVSRFLRACSNVNLLNVYGPTETVVFATAGKVDLANADRPPIGRPLKNKFGYILDSRGLPLPVGCIGELHVGGAGLARGYLNDSELTARKFISSPFRQGDRLYRTGDRARYLPDGNIDYVGRDDFQVKIRGHRIELGEIESALREYPGVRQSVVVPCDGPAGKYLVGYCVADSLRDEAEVLDWLSRRLPTYLVPTRLVSLEKFPLGSTGKLDRKALPHPEWRSVAVTPRNDTELAIGEIFGELFAKSSKDIDVRWDFFRLGGSSLLAIRLAHRLSQRFDRHVTVAQVFRDKTIEQLAKTLACLSPWATSIPVARELAEYPLSYAQERLWFIEQYEQGTPAYHMPILLRLREGVSGESLIRALRAIVERHEVLRTFFVPDEHGRESQRVQTRPLTVHTRSYENFHDYQRALARDLDGAFDLRREYPIRASLYEVATQRYLLVNMHHIASDGWSIDIFEKELVAYYEQFELNRPLRLPTLAIQYKDFAVWQRSLPTGEELEYWRSRLANYETLQLPTDKPRPSRLSYVAKSLPFSLTPELSQKLRELAQARGCTLYTVLLAGFYVLLNKYCGQTDIILGTPVTNRPHSSTQDLIGFFVNMLVQRERLELDRPITHLIDQIHRHYAEAQAHQDLPFEKLVRELSEGRDSSRHPLFQVTFAVQSFGRKEESLTRYFHPVDTDRAMTACDLGCLIDDSQASLRGTFLFAESLFESSTIQRWANHYLHILTQVVDETEKSLEAYRALTPEEYRQMVYEWSSRRQIPPPEKTIDEIFEEQVLRTPDAVAIVDDGATLSYREVNEKANQLAHALRRAGVATETPVGIFLERSAFLVIGILGVLKAGGTCVALDIATPAERLLSIFDDTKLSIVLTDGTLRLSEYSSRLTLVDVERSLTGSPENLARSRNVEQLAFLVYTSGSTGNPKGVMLPHRTFARCAYWARDVFRFRTEDRFLFKSARAPEEIFFPLFIGAALIVAPPGAERDSAELIRTLVENRVTVANFTPSFLAILLDRIDKQIFLKHVFCAGEPLPRELRERFLSRSNAHLYNFYGLAEAPYTAYWRSVASRPEERAPLRFSDSVIGERDWWAETAEGDARV